MGMIRAEKLVFEYDKRDEEGNVIGSHRAIDGFDIDDPQGSFVAILGHNGSGKTTLAKHMNAILVPTGGTMWVDGRDTKDPNELWNIRQSAGMVFQNPDNQLVAAIVEEDVAFGPENLGVPADEIRKRVDYALEKVGMSAYRTHSPAMLSGGQKQRVAIARALVNDPPIILADEPTGNLDSKSGKVVAEEFRKINEELGKTLLMVTHDPQMASRCKRVIFLKDGYVMNDVRKEGTEEEFYRTIIGEMEKF